MRKKVIKNVYKTKPKGGDKGRTKLPGDDDKKPKQDMSKGKTTDIPRLQKRIKKLQDKNDAHRSRLRKGATKDNATYQALIDKNIEEIKRYQNIIRERTRDDAPKRSKSPPVDPNIDDAGPVGQEARDGKKKKKTMLDKDKSTEEKKEKKEEDENTRTSMEDYKPKDKKKKKKKTMLGGNPYMSGKGRYGDIKPGVYKGQR